MHGSSGHDPWLVALSVGDRGARAALPALAGRGIRGTPEAAVGCCLASAAGFWRRHLDLHFMACWRRRSPAGTVYLVLPTIILVFDLLRAGCRCRCFCGSIGTPRCRAAPPPRCCSAPHRQHALWSGSWSGGNFARSRNALGHGGAVDLNRRINHPRLWRPPAGGSSRAMDGAASDLTQRWRCGCGSLLHYTAMYGMHFVAAARGMRMSGGLAASQQISGRLVVALLFFGVAAGFLLSLVPIRGGQRRGATPRSRPRHRACTNHGRADPGWPRAGRGCARPLGGLGQPLRARVAAASGRGGSDVQQTTL